MDFPVEIAGCNQLSSEGTSVQKKRVVVIGAGVLGLFTALELLDGQDCELVVLDRGSPGDGSSGRSVGMVETQYISEPDVEVRAFGREAYSRLELEHGLNFEHGGYLRIGRSDQELRQFQASVEAQQRFGISDVELLPAEKMAEMWPHLVTDDLVGGLWGKWDGYVDGFEVCQLLSKAVRNRGGVVQTNTTVTGARRKNGTWSIDSFNGVYEADIVVNAAGAHGGVVGALFDAPVEVLPQLHSVITIKFAHEGERMPFVMDYIPGSGADGVYFRPEGPGQIIAGLHTDEGSALTVDPDTQLRSISDDTLEKIATLLMERLHGAENLELGRSWQGFYPTTRDHKPIVGKHPGAPGVVCALGAGGSGIQLAPAIGRLAAEAVREVSMPSFRLASEWSCERFSASV